MPRVTPAGTGWRWNSNCVCLTPNLICKLSSQTALQFPVPAVCQALCPAPGAERPLSVPLRGTQTCRKEQLGEQTRTESGGRELRGVGYVGPWGGPLSSREESRKEGITEQEHFARELKYGWKSLEVCSGKCIPGGGNSRYGGMEV